MEAGIFLGLSKKAKIGHNSSSKAGMQTGEVETREGRRLCARSWRGPDSALRDVNK